MCDYSLTGIPNRLAVAGENLVTYRFPTGSLGMASAEDVAAKVDRLEEQQLQRRGIWKTIQYWFSSEQDEPVCAVCLPPGTDLLMMRVPEQIRRQYALSAIEEVTFTQLSAEAYQYRDAIRFRNGRQLLLQSLRDGVPFQVMRQVSHASGNGNEIRERTYPAEVPSGTV